MTSVLAILALSIGRFLGWNWLDPLMGVVGALDYAAIISLVTHHPRTTAYYQDLIGDFHEIFHLTLEVNKCEAVCH